MDEQEQTYLVHLEKRPFLHLLKSAHLMSIGLASEVDLSISTLADLRNDLELINLELDATLAEKSTLAATV